MGKEVTTQVAQKILRERLIGSNINRISNFITGWSIKLIGPKGPEYNIEASEIIIPHIEQWRDAFAILPTDLLNTNEPDDVICAAILFSSMNKWPIINITIADNSDMTVKFKNDNQIIIKANVKYIDWTWEVNKENGNNILHCASGILTLNE